MSETYRQLHKDFWESADVENLDPIEKLLYLYAISCPLSNMEGIYKISLKRIAFETGIDKEMVQKIMDRLESEGLTGYKDGWIVVCKAAKHMSGSPKVASHAEKVYVSMPLHIKEWADSIGYIYHMDRVSYTRLDKTILDKTAPTRITADAEWEKNGMILCVNQARYDRLCEEYGKGEVDEWMLKAGNYVISNGKKPYKDYSAAVETWMKKDKVAKRVGYEAKQAEERRVKDPVCCKQTVLVADDTGRCRECGAWWVLTEGEWVIE